jgi:hypothetical protein
VRHGQTRTLTIADSRMQDDRLRVRFDGVEDRDAAARCKRRQLRVIHFHTGLKAHFRTCLKSILTQDMKTADPFPGPAAAFHIGRRQYTGANMAFMITRQPREVFPCTS